MMSKQNFNCEINLHIFPGETEQSFSGFMHDIKTPITSDVTAHAEQAHSNFQTEAVVK